NRRINAGAIEPLSQRNKNTLQRLRTVFVDEIQAQTAILSRGPDDSVASGKLLNVTASLIDLESDVSLKIKLLSDRVCHLMGELEIEIIRPEVVGVGPRRRLGVKIVKCGPPANGRRDGLSHLPVGVKSKAVALAVRLCRQLVIGDTRAALDARLSVLREPP